MKSIKINMFFNILKSLMSVIFPLITFPYASRVLGVENIGKVQYAQSVISYFTLIAGLGITSYAVREGAKIRDDREKLSKFSSEIMLITMLTTSFSYLLFFTLLMCGAFNGNILLMCVTSLTILFTTFAIEWINQIEEDFTYISIRTIIFQFLSLVLMLIFVKNRNDYVIYAFLQVISSCGYFFLNLVYSKKFITISPHFMKFDAIKKHMKPIMVIFGSSVAISIYLNIDVVILSVIKGDYQVGLYSASVKIMNVIKTLIGSITTIGVARLSHFLKERKWAEYKVLLKNCLNSELLLLIPCCLGVWAIAYYGIVAFSGESYAGATLSCKILGANTVSAVINGLFMMQYFIPMGKENYGCIATICGAVSNVILDVALIPSLGLNGAALATLISENIVLGVFLFYLREDFTIRELFSEVPKYLIAAIPIIPICLVIINLFDSPFLILVISVACSSVAYYLLLLLLGVSMAKDLLMDLLRKIKIIN